MENNRKSLSYNSIITGLMTAAYAVIMGLLYAYYYDLNDDVLMKDILSGAFTGSPEGHNIQMLYPISFVISLLYRVYGKTDCYGLYLILCQYISLFIVSSFSSGVIAEAVLMRLKKKSFKGKELLVRIASALIVFIVITALVPGHLLIVQYTFTVAMLCAAAAVLIFEKRDVAATVLIVLAFLTRSEMTLLMLPFVFLVIFYRLIDEKKIKRELTVAAFILAGLLASEGLHFAGYSSPEWKEFTSFFNSRTDIYDFYQIPDYEENKEFYDSIDLKKSEYELLVDYNFGLDDSIDAEKMAQIAAYSKSIWQGEGLVAGIKRALPLYLYRLRAVGTPQSYEYPMTDAPWNIFVGLMYLTALVIMLVSYADEKNLGLRIWNSVWKLILLFAGRSLLWMYIMVRGRDPIRITHSLYFIELTLLTLIAGERLLHLVEKAAVKSNEEEDYPYVPAHVFSGFCLVLVVAVCAVYIPAQLSVLRAECDGRGEYNKAYEELDKYFKNNSDKLYLIDVYTSVSYEDNGYTYSQKMLTNVDNSLSNCVMMGGWASKSPAEKDKLHNLGYDESMEDIALGDNVFVVTDKDMDMEWLKNYYLDKEKSVAVTREDDVAGEFVIWKVKPAE